MALIEENRHRSVVVIDAANVVVGTLSDGDARKAILDHRLLSTPVSQVMNTNFIAVGPNERGQAAALLEQAHIFLVPVIDREGRLVDVMRAYE